MTWTFQTFLSKWKPTARFVVACLLKAAGGAAAATDPANVQLYQCLTASSEQAAEHLFDTLAVEQQREVEDCFTRLRPYLDQHAALIRRLEALAEQQEGQILSVESLSELIRSRLPADLKPALHCCLDQLGGIQKQLREIKGILNKFKPGVSYENEEERAILRQLREKFRSLPPEQQKAANWSEMADRLFDAGLFDLREEHENAARAAEQEHNRALAAAEHFKAYRAACEKERWPAALASLRQAVELNPQLAPFDWEQYELLDILGAGGFGTVFRCRDRHLDKEVAIKAIHTGELARGVQEVFKEAAILTKLKHPAIIAVQGAHFADASKQRPYIVMDYFPSQSLATRLKQHGPLPVAEFMRVVRPVAEALRAAHQAKPHPVYHRDVKPDNLLLGEAGQIKVIDYGLAVRVAAAHNSVSRPAERRTVRDQCYAGTLEYAPPEQKGELSQPVGPYSDIYAFGRTCCKLLFGVPTLHRHPTDPKPHHYNRTVDPLPQALVDLLERCGQHKVEDRPQDFQDVLDVLDAIAHELDLQQQRQREHEEEARRRETAAVRQCGGRGASAPDTVATGRRKETGRTAPHHPGRDAGQALCE